MAVGRGVGAPYTAVLWLLRWAIGNWRWIDGESSLCGVDLADLIERDPHRFFAVVEALAVRQFSLSEESAAKLQAVLYPKPKPTMETWGTSRESINAVRESLTWWELNEPLPAGER